MGEDGGCSEDRPGEDASLLPLGQEDGEGGRDGGR
jgi:hypothetical protein